MMSMRKSVFVSVFIAFMAFVANAQTFYRDAKNPEMMRPVGLRSRGKVDYRIPDTPLSVHFAIEPYWCEFSRDAFNMLQKIRWYAGFDIELTDEISIRPEYICHAYHNHAGRYARRTYDDHIIYMTFIIKL